MMDEIKQDWLSLVDKAVYHERSAADSHIYLSPCQRLAPGPLTLEKYDNFVPVMLHLLVFLAGYCCDYFYAFICMLLDNG